MNRPSLLLPLAWAAAFFLACVSPAKGALIEKAPGTVGLFLEIPATDLPGKVSSLVSRRRVVTVNLPALRAQQSVGARLLFNFFAGANFEGVVEQFIERGGDDFTLMGKLRGDETSTFALAVKDGVAVMNVRHAQGLFQVRHLGESFYELRQVDAGKFPPCGTTERHAIAPLPQRPPESITTAKAAKVDNGARIDVMVVYTPAARAGAGGISAMEALINLAVDEANATYQLSEIAPRLRLVHQQEIDYTESGSFNLDLDRLTNANDGVIDQVHALRNAYGADIVSMFIEDEGLCGLAWLMTALSSAFESSAFNVVWWNCATGLYTFAHELAHNMGCAHDRQNASGALYDYSYGWRFTTAGNITNRTIMAYAPGERISHFSNPNVLYQGVPTGVPVGQINAAHNALSINNAAFTVANWRPEVVSCTRRILPASTNISNEAFAGEIQIIASSNNCPWTAVSQSPFITLIGPTNGLGDGTIQYSIGGFAGLNSRTGAIMVAGWTFTIVQTPGIPIAEALDLTGHQWITGGNGPWFGQREITQDGVDAARSGILAHGQESYVQALFYGPGQVSFWCKVGSELDYDFLHLLVDGVTNQSISGFVDWQFRTIPLTHGPHTVRWTYRKDGSVSENGDAVWLDLVRSSGQPYFTNGLARLSGNTVRFQVHGPASNTVILQGSPDVSAWSSIATGMFSPAGVWVFTNALPAVPTRYYRAVLP